MHNVSCAAAHMLMLWNRCGVPHVNVLMSQNHYQSNYDFILNRQHTHTHIACLAYTHKHYTHIADFRILLLHFIVGTVNVKPIPMPSCFILQMLNDWMVWGESYASYSCISSLFTSIFHLFASCSCYVRFSCFFLVYFVCLISPSICIPWSDSVCVCVCLLSMPNRYKYFVEIQFWYR